MSVHKLVAGSVFWTPAFCKEDLEYSPSRNFISLREELSLRASCIRYISKVGKTLRFPQLAIATACVYFHHFYMRYSFEDNNKYVVSNACIFLASKSEECRKTLREVIRASFSVRHDTDPPSRQTEQYKEISNEILRKEGLLLQAIEFSFQVSHPYQFLMAAIKTLLKDELEQNYDLIKHTAQIAWFFVNDSLRSPICLFYPPQHIALAAVDLSLRYLRYIGEEKGGKIFLLSDGWWTQFDCELKKETLQLLCEQILDVFDYEYLKPLKAQDLISLPIVVDKPEPEETGNFSDQNASNLCNVQQDISNISVVNNNNNNNLPPLYNNSAFQFDNSYINNSHPSNYNPNPVYNPNLPPPPVNNYVLPQHNMNGNSQNNTNGYMNQQLNNANMSSQNGPFQYNM